MFKYSKIISRYIKVCQTLLDMKKKYLTPQEVAKELGISKQTLLRYEKRGIFPRPKRNLVNRWREYNQLDLVKLKRILGRI